MNLPKAGALFVVTIMMGSCVARTGLLSAQSSVDTPSVPPEPSSSLILPPEKTSYLKDAVAQHDYVRAERLLLTEIDQDPHSVRSASLLAYLGSLYFLNHDYLNAAIAWKKSDAITTLNPELKFSLAMAYVELRHPDWAETVLESLAAQHQKTALYVYWLGRLDYDAHRYGQATSHFQQAIALDPALARAYDNLGLCYFYQNQNMLAVANFNKAIKLDSGSQHPSPWPFLNLAEVLELLNHDEEAETNIRRAIRLDPHLAAAHYRLATLLEHRDRLEPAATELLEAIRIDAQYAEPHVALAQIYKRLGRKEDASREVQTYRMLRGSSSAQ